MSNSIIGLGRNTISDTFFIAITKIKENRYGMKVLVKGVGGSLTAEKVIRKD